jgi:prevent-host-death family protein
MQFNILEARNKLSYLIKSARAGEDVIIANRGEPVVRLVPVELGLDKADRLRIGLGKWLVQNPLPKHLLETHEVIEAGIREERGSWD